MFGISCITTYGYKRHLFKIRSFEYFIQDIVLFNEKVTICENRVTDLAHQVSRLKCPP